MFLKLQWERPVECRLCQCPVADAGVRMDKLDPDKLSEWWKQKLETKLELMDLDNGWICQFCLWDARMEHDFSDNREHGNNSKLDWWDGFDSNVFFYKNYYKDAVIKRCFVNAAVQGKASNILVKKPERANSHHTTLRDKPTNCIFCHQTFATKKAAFFHGVKNHKDCKKCIQCRIFFPDQLAHRAHVIKVHRKLRKCGFCGKQTILLYGHMLKKHSNLIHLCKYQRCKTFFVTIRDKVQHEKEFHQFKGYYKCIYCDNKDYLTRISLVRHLRKKHQDKSLQCDCSTWCKKFFLTEAKKMEHVKIAHKGSAAEVECEVCKQKVLQLYLNIHMRQFHGRSVKPTNTGDTICCYCQDTFPSLGSAYRHVKKAHSNIETFKCGSCIRFFKSVELKKEHYQKVHRGQIRCLYCVNWECSNRQNLWRHLREKHQGEVIQCRYSNKCGLYFKTQEDLKKHTMEIHENDPTNKLQCIYCRKFVPCHLERHINYHHKSIAIQCDFVKKCRSFFLSKEDRQAHILEVHQPGVPYHKLKCPCCPKTFVLTTKMKIHAMKVHSKGIVNCIAKGCKFVCTDNIELQAHCKKQHADLQNKEKFQCIYCNFKANYRNTLHNHIQRLHGTENMKCHFCPEKNFKSKLSIEVHMTWSHFSKFCHHCRSRISKDLFKKHCRVQYCKFCKLTSLCVYSHARHERICSHWNKAS